SSPEETVSRVGAVLDRATHILETLDVGSASELSCPVRFRASNIRRYASAPPPPYPCGDGVRYDAVLFPESVLGEASGCADPVDQTLGIFVGAGFYRIPSDAGATYAHEIGHLAGVPADHAGWDGTLLAGGGHRTGIVPPALCALFLEYARSRGAERDTAACI